MLVPNLSMHDIPNVLNVQSYLSINILSIVDIDTMFSYKFSLSIVTEVKCSPLQPGSRT